MTRKAIELALAGDIAALRLCLERLIPPRKDRPIHLILPPIENVQQISLAMARVAEEREAHAQRPVYLFFTCSLQAMACASGQEKGPGASQAS